MKGEFFFWGGEDVFQSFRSQLKIKIIKKREKQLKRRAKHYLDGFRIFLSRGEGG
jgi:hypothetical protein